MAARIAKRPVDTVKKLADGNTIEAAFKKTAGSSSTQAGTIKRPAKTVKMIVTTLVLSAAFGGLLWGTLAEGTEYYMHVDEVLAEPDAWYGKNLQVHGYVVPGSRLVKPNTLEYRFKVENNGAVIDAEYTGIVPDTFQDGSEVVISGQLSPHGFSVKPNGVMAKCPSKYEPKPTLGAAASSY